MEDKKELITIEETKKHLERYRNENYQPTKETLDKFDRVCELYEHSNLPFYKLFEQVGITGFQFYMVKNLIEGSDNKVTRAREAKQRALVESITEIMEDKTLSVEERKLKVYAIEKRLQLESPKRYRDKIETQINIQSNSQVVRFEIPSDTRDK